MPRTAAPARAGVRGLRAGDQHPVRLRFRAGCASPTFPRRGAAPDQSLFVTLPETILCGGYCHVPPLRIHTKPWDVAAA